ncbi:MAG TPA: N,N-dimethylformamidase beta subunit family domain-containing protein, partial [Hyalangium sp.]|nr:N,N-dimethylformamidase beta subunit family domain-containing protein [Hyalangium sp.]
GMVGSGLCVVGAVAWLWAGGLSGEARVRHLENRDSARGFVRGAKGVSAPASERRTGDTSPQGDPSWRKGRPASPAELQVTVSSPAALAGERISVEISTHDGAPVRAELFRLGVYGGTGAAKVWSGGPYTVSTAVRCSRAPCPGRQAFSFEVARAWAPGLYLVKVTRADGLRSFTSIIVKAPQAEGPRS